MFCDIDHHDLITAIFQQIAFDDNKPLRQIKRLFFVKKDKNINRRFWEMVDELLPGHSYAYVCRCPACGGYELCEQLPVKKEMTNPVDTK